MTAFCKAAGDRHPRREIYPPPRRDIYALRLLCAEPLPPPELTQGKYKSTTFFRITPRAGRCARLSWRRTNQPGSGAP
eukprot:scaffold12108_cov97-Isochrysis_galbana.AAC.5